MVVEVVAGIGLVAAIGEVGIPAVFLRAAAGEVLDHARDAFAAQLLALEAADVGGGHLRGEVGIFAEGAAHARPARFGGKVGHRVQGGADADGEVFLPGDVAKSLDEVCIARWRPGPMGQAIGRSLRC